MATTANNSITNHIFHEPPLKTQDLYSPELVEESVRMPLPYGMLEWKYWHFDGILILYTNNHFNGQYQFEKRNELDVVSLEFNLRGSYIIHHVGKEYRTQSPQHNIIYTPGVHNTFQNGGLLGETFKIQFVLPVFLKIIEDSNDALKRFAEKVLEKKPVVIAQHSLMVTPELRQVINDILACRYTGGLKKLFLLSKSIEILVLQAEAYDKATRDGREPFLKPKSDAERIQYAREYLDEHVSDPPSLSGLSRIIGLNEYKLKRSFKETFHTTVFGYLSDVRLERARQALLESQKTISEIAYDLGYSSPQHFSMAFRKKFGVPPSSVKK
jgi:AraC-like DNA-binding protein